MLQEKKNKVAPRHPFLQWVAPSQKLVASNYYEFNKGLLWKVIYNHLKLGKNLSGDFGTSWGNC
ncbi:hypothetical protein Hanom_Chr09g00788161 [Helianthus anomalus]